MQKRTTMREIGVALLGAEREDRSVNAIARLVWAHTQSQKTSDAAQRVPAMFFDMLEAEMRRATGGRRRTLLEVYDLMLGAVDRCVGDMSDVKTDHDWARVCWPDRYRKDAA